MKPILALSAAAFLFLSCGKDINNPAALRDAVAKHLGGRKGLDLDLTKIDLQVGAIAFRGNEADADVTFNPKGGAPGGMTIHYAFERKGNEWVVKGKAESGAGHGAGAAVPHGEGMGTAPQIPQSGQLPPGHPSVIPEQKPPEQKKQ